MSEHLQSCAPGAVPNHLPLPWLWLAELPAPLLLCLSASTCDFLLLSCPTCDFSQLQVTFGLPMLGHPSRQTWHLNWQSQLLPKLPAWAGVGLANPGAWASAQSH